MAMAVSTLRGTLESSASAVECSQVQASAGDAAVECREREGSQADAGGWPG
jgi:hypothetical protein